MVQTYLVDWQQGRTVNREEPTVSTLRTLHRATRAATAYDFMTPAEAARLVTGGSTYAPDETTQAPPGDGPRAGWSGVLVMEGQITGDGRIIESNALRWENLPIPLRWSSVDNGGHDGAEVVGTIDTIERAAGGKITATGSFDLGSERGVEARRQVAEGLTTGVSVDLDDVSFEVRIAGEIMDEMDAMMAEAPVEEQPEEPERDADGRVTVASIKSDDEVMVTTDARIRAATMVAIPAFNDARLVLSGEEQPPAADQALASEGATFAVETGDSVRWTEEVDGETVERTGVVQAISDDGSTATVEVQGGDTVEVPVADLTETEDDGDDDEEDAPPALVAGAGPVRPPTSWFRDPSLSEPTPLTVTDDGRVYGHLALWGTCHTGYAGQCVSPPASSSGYAYFRTGSLVTSDGTEVAVGPITMDTLHADTKRNLTAAAALAHYEDTGRAVAYVASGEDQHGIWIAGSMRAEATAEQVRALRASPLSGDWRRVGAGMELVAALAVNMPGFPVPRTKALVASGSMRSLVAAGMLSPRQVIAPGSPGALSADDLRYLKAMAARERERQRRETPAAESDLRTRARLAALRVRAGRYRGTTTTV